MPFLPPVREDIKPTLQGLVDIARHNYLYVVETHDDIYLGKIQVTGRAVHVHNGFVGRPVVLDYTEIVSVVPAVAHPDVEEVKR